MTPEARDWLDGLLDSTASPPRDRPEAAPDAAAVAAERGILARHLAGWLDRIETVLAARHVLAANDSSLDPDAVIVLTTSPVGIRLVADLLGRGEPGLPFIAERLACVTEADYRRHCMRHPDGSQRLHLNHWSWVKTSLPRRRWAAFARHPLETGEAYWLHRTGTSGAGAADGRSCDLWRFDGHHATLLQACIVERGVGGDPGTLDA